MSEPIDEAITQTPTAEFVRKYGGSDAWAAAREKAARILPKIARMKLGEEPSDARKAVVIAVHAWIKDNADLLPPAVFMEYLESLNEHRLWLAAYQRSSD